MGLTDEWIERWARRALATLTSVLVGADVAATALVAWWAVFGLLIAISIEISSRMGVLRTWAENDPEPMDWVPSEGHQPSAG